MENIDPSWLKRFIPATWSRCSGKSGTAPRSSKATSSFSPSNLRKDFANMLKDEEGADVTFSVGDRLFRAHRRILAARSPVFKAELFGRMKENSDEPIKIDDMEPSIFEALLYFIYTDTLPGNSDLDENAALQHLLVAADRYGMHRLMAMCEWKLCQSIDVQTVATTLVLAEQHHRVLLKNACIKFVSSDNVFNAIKETDGFQHLVESCPSVVVEILQQKLPSRFGQVARTLTSLARRVSFHPVFVLVWVTISVGVGYIIILSCVGGCSTESGNDLLSSNGGCSTEGGNELLSSNGGCSTESGNEASLSWLPRLGSHELLQEFQESAWLNSDI